MEKVLQPPGQMSQFLFDAWKGLFRGIFLIFHRNICCDSSRQDGSNEGLQRMFYGEIRKNYP